MVKAAPEPGADDGHPPLLGTDRQLLRAGHGQRQHHRPVHRARSDAGRLGAVPRHDGDSLSSTRSGSPRTAPPAASATRSVPTPRSQGLVNEVGQVFDTVVRRIRKQAAARPSTCPRPCACWSAICAGISPGRRRRTRCPRCSSPRSARRSRRASSTVRTVRCSKQEFELFREELDGFQFALSRPYFTLPEKDRRQRRPAVHHGQSLHLQGLYGVRRRSATTTRCDRCADRRIGRTATRAMGLSGSTCPPHPEKYIRVDDIEEGIGALETILLDKTSYLSFTSGDGACLGCAEKDGDPPVRRHGRSADAAARSSAMSRTSTS